uniref:PDZ domain containing 11 n=1 Tax=Buteo japonicus TaxID=224669 RepID=A0A8C0BPU4_9AVES
FARHQAAIRQSCAISWSLPSPQSVAGALQSPLPILPQSHLSVLDGHRGEALGLGCLGCEAGELLHWPCGESLLLSLLFPSQVIPDSDAHRAGLQEGDQVLSVNDVDFQDIEHSKAVEILKTAREITMRVRYFPYNYQRQKERTVH